MEQNGPVILLSTTPPGVAASIAKALVTEKQAACVNIIPCQSVFNWKGEHCTEREDLMIIKTEKGKVPALLTRIRELHPYGLLEMIAISISGGYQPYLDWIHAEVT